EDAIICDIGAGTGSCTVELALQAPFGKVYAFEINPDALEVLQQNIDHFQVTNVQVVQGDASETLKEMEIRPDYAFIGGTKGNLAIILDELYRKNPSCAVVITAITLETVAAVTTYYAKHPQYHLGISQISTARSKKAGSSHLMIAQNPVYVMSVEKGR
uniref:precorrin-6Y C5,15-methyltransferase (decarboxylating) subunit CbiT n=1 Tax=uncultured Megasphaera sp. TaxID=165188 RepID=UPI0025E7B497